MTQWNACIIEDATYLSQLLNTILMREGIETKVINDGAIALDYLNENTPDLILLDLNLPNVSGIEILSYIRSQDRLKHVKIAVVTASPNIAQAIEDVVELILLKPVTASQVRDIIHQLMP